MYSTEQEQALQQRKKELIHRGVTFFEDAPCYEKEDLLALNDLHWKLVRAKKPEEIEACAKEYEAKQTSMKQIAGAPERTYLWPEGAMPSLGNYTENPELRYNHGPEFRPYMYALLIPEDQTPKGAVVVCAGGDHGDCTLHEGYQSCLDLMKQGYQCFLLLNRTNHCPYAPQEAGVDASRAIRMVRKNAGKYRIDENRVAFAGFSNGGLTAEACIQYFSGTQRVKNHFKDYVPDEYDSCYGAPDAVICVYGPRFKGTGFDYTNVVYPPTFFAVGREDSAMENLNATLPDLMAHHVEVEVHTFSGVPHGQSGVTFYGNNSYPHFQLWVPLADAFVQNVFAKSVIKRTPDVLESAEYHYDAFENGEVLLNKKKGHLPAMGWNSWNAFGSGNTEALTKAMADAMVELELDKLGYQYVVLDDGCYRPQRVDGKLANEPVKFPTGFRALADYIHDKGLKFGMYNDIGTNLCAGAAVGTCGHEATDAQSYIDWGVDFLKVDNCYYLWDNATFSDAANAKYVYAPNIRGIRVTGDGFEKEFSAVSDGKLTGRGAQIKEDYATNLGTFDGTGPWPTPVGAQSAELAFTVCVPKAGEYKMTVSYATATENGTGSWLQAAVGEKENAVLLYDDFLPATENKETFADSPEIVLTLQAGENLIRLMNHRRQENTLSSYAALLEGLNRANPEHDVIFSICEWGKTQPQNWGYKVGDSWRILNDITFRVGADGDPGVGSWTDGYTPSVTSQYNKAVIMDEFAGLDRGWNDPDMLMVGMNGLTDNMYRTHMAMWCMMNAPLMLGLDLRRVKKGDELWKIIANRDLIALNQDALGIAAKRVACILTKKLENVSAPADENTAACDVTEEVAIEHPDTEYIRDNNRVDILAKPLSDGGLAISFINVSEEAKKGSYSIHVSEIVEKLGHKMVNADVFAKSEKFCVTDLWTGEQKVNKTGVFEVSELEACENVTVKVLPV